MTTGNKRLDKVLAKAMKMGLGGGKYALDGYNNKVLTGDTIYAITTRVSASCDHFLMEIYEEDETDKCNAGR